MTIINDVFLAFYIKQILQLMLNKDILHHLHPFCTFLFDSKPLGNYFTRRQVDTTGPEIDLLYLF